MLTRWHRLAPVVLVCACAPEEPQFRQVADVKELMISILEPAAEVYWDAVGTIIDENGIHDFAPTTPEEWEAVRNAAYVIAESGNLLMMRPRALDQGEWITLSQALIDVGRRAVAAADARNPAQVFDAGAEVYFACSECHAVYALETLRPSDARSQ